jgi:hypothetical protein
LLNAAWMTLDIEVNVSTQKEAMTEKSARISHKMNR